jgi:hypothetical protein
MKRVVAASVTVLLLAGCSTAERPEGVVERWLLASNRGQAGLPLRYAERAATVAIRRTTGVEGADAFGEIEVGRARRCGYRGPGECIASVPFRLVTADGDEFRLDALVGSSEALEGGTGSRVFAITGPDRSARFPSEGGGSIGAAGASDWFLALMVGLGLGLAAELLLRIVRRSSTAR